MTLADDRRSEAPPRHAPEGENGVNRTFASLEIQPYRILFIAGMLSFISVQGQMVARGWLANELTDSNTGLGGVFMAFGIVLLLFTPIGGVLADRLSKRFLLALTQVILSSSALWIGLAVTFDFIDYWQLVGASAVQAFGFALLGPARMAMTSELVGRDLLPNAIVLGQMSMHSTRVIGPALAGMAIGVAWIGTDGVYYVATGFSLLALFQILRLPPAEPRPDGPRRTALADMLDGVSYVRAHREVKMLMITSFVVVMVAFPYLAFLPRVADEIFDVGASGYGVMSAVSAVGAVSVSLYVAGRAGGDNAWAIQMVSGVAFGFGLLLLAIAPTYLLALLAIMLIGGAASGFQSMNNSLTLGLSEFEYHGRVQSLMMLSFSGFGMAALPLGGVADAIGLRTTFVLMGVITVVAMLTYRLLRGKGAPVDEVAFS